MDNSFRVIAIIAAFNEGDVISAVIGHLVHNGVDVYLIDNHSTDDTVRQASRWLGEGLIRIEPFPAAAEQAGRFEWTEILHRKEELANTLEADWFIHHDADEIREGPWPNLTLKEAIHWVDRQGYNCIDFRVLNFPPVDDGFRPGNNPETYFRLCEDPPDVDKVQRKAWKATGTRVSLAASGGHDVLFPERRVFPVRFLLRHYPVRGQVHGLRKVFQERKPRFSSAERSAGWHVQYDRILDGTHSFLKDPRSLLPFDLEKTRLELMLPGELARNFARIQEERDELRRDLASLEADRIELRRHAANLEKERDNAQLHARNLQGELDASRAHAADLETGLRELRQHAANLEKERADLRQHAANLQQERDELGTRAKNLEADVAGLKAKATNLEERQRLLERELAEIRKSFAWRTTSAVRRLFGFSQKDTDSS